MFDIKEAQRQGINDSINAEIDKRFTNEKLEREAWEASVVSVIDKLWGEFEELKNQLAKATENEKAAENRIKQPTNHHLREDERHFAAYRFLDEFFAKDNGESLIGYTPSYLTDLFFMWLEEHNIKLQQGTQLRRICTNAANRKFKLKVVYDRFERRQDR